MGTTTTTDTIVGWLKTLGPVSLSEGKGEADLIFRAKGTSGRFCAVTQSLHATRLDDLRGRLSHAVLRSRKACNRKRDMPAAIVLLPRWSRRAETEAGEFIKNYAPDCAWGIVSADGGGILILPGRGEIARSEPSETMQPATRTREAGDLFSDANRLMLKILLLQHLSPDMWGGPRGPVRNALELARLAGVSPEAAYRIVRTLETEGFLDARARPIAIVRRDALFARWLEREKHVCPPAWHVRWLYGRPKDPREVFGQSVQSEYAVAGFGACEILGVLHATRPRLFEVHVAVSLAEAMRAWRFEQVDAANSDLVLRRALHRRSVFGGRVQRDGVFVVDVLQAALDVATSTARGLEQAEYIIKNVIGAGGSA